MTRPLHFLWLARLPTLCGAERVNMTAIPENVTCANCARMWRNHPMNVTHWIRNGRIACYDGRQITHEAPTSENLARVTCKTCLKASLPPLALRRLCVHFRGQIEGVTHCGTELSSSIRLTDEWSAVTCRRCIASRKRR